MEETGEEVSKRWIWLCACVLAGCVSPSEFYGAYDGTLTSKETQGTMIFMLESDHEVFVAPSSQGSLVVQLRDECAVTASILDGESFEFSGQRCEHEGSSKLNVEASGTGTLSGDTLTVTYTLTGTLERNDQPLDYATEATFVGSR